MTMARGTEEKIIWEIKEKESARSRKDGLAYLRSLQNQPENKDATLYVKEITEGKKKKLVAAFYEPESDFTNQGFIKVADFK